MTRVSDASNLPVTYAEIDLDAIAYNVRALKAHIGPKVQLITVVKANAYGHGAVEVARTTLKHGADRLAVARASEGIELRWAGIAAPILVMGYSGPAEIEIVAEHGLTATVTEVETAETLSARAAALGRTIAVHVKVDTGMGRFGLLPDEVTPFLAKITSLPGLALEGMFTHFAVADSPDKTYAWEQFVKFQAALKSAEAAGFHIPLRHVCNSAATMDLPEMHLDAVRPGIALYGLRPAADVVPAVPIRPALTLKSHVARVRTLPAGSSISYGRTYITRKDTPVALIPVGYGDGYHRLLSNRGAVLINGKRAPIAGRVCMDQFVVDISACGSVEVGAEVVLVGRQGEGCISADEVAAWAETINYEVTTSLLPRAPRVYRENGILR